MLIHGIEPRTRRRHKGRVRAVSPSALRSQFNAHSNVLNYEYKQDAPCLVPINCNRRRAGRG